MGAGRRWRDLGFPLPTIEAVEGHAAISNEILASYAADAAREVEGVHDLVDGALPRRRGVRVETEDGAVKLEVHIALEWGVSVQEVGRAVQGKVRDYVQRMTDVELAAVDVVVDEIGPP
jgi:uncharacterized alkaline shock family protein YloU